MNAKLLETFKTPMFQGYSAVPKADCDVNSLFFGPKVKMDDPQVKELGHNFAAQLRHDLPVGPV